MSARPAHLQRAFRQVFFLLVVQCFYANVFRSVEFVNQNWWWCWLARNDRKQTINVICIHQLPRSGRSHTFEVRFCFSVFFVLGRPHAGISSDCIIDLERFDLKFSQIILSLSCEQKVVRKTASFSQRFPGNDVFMVKLSFLPSFSALIYFFLWYL